MWLSNRRNDWRKDRLDPTWAAELEALPGWAWDYLADDWAAAASALGVFVAREGHARVRQSHVENGIRLGSWVNTQRHERARGRLASDRRAILEGFSGWTWHPLADDWAAGLDALRAYQVRNGHARVPQNHVEGAVLLGSWVASRRLERNAGTLSEQRAAELDAIPGWMWDPIADDWTTALGALQAFVEREGHTRVPSAHVEAGVRLGKWVTKRRSERNSGRLDPAHVAELERIQGWTWDPRTDDWNAGMHSLHSFVDREGHGRVPTGHVEADHRLGSWVVTRRADHGKGLLPAARVTELEAIPGWTWDPFTDQWVAGFVALRVFVAREGHALVPQAWVEGGFPLGAWATRKRGELKAGRLDDVRASELTAFPGWSWDPVQDKWDAGLVSLFAFVAREGHARVPQKHVEGPFRLGVWVTRQRQNRKVGELTLERAAALEAVPGWTWDPIGDLWIVGIAALKAFVAREGHARVPVAAIESGFKLGQWVSVRRTEYRARRLDRLRIVELESFPGWSWDVGRGGRKRP